MRKEGTKSGPPRVGMGSRRREREASITLRGGGQRCKRNTGRVFPTGS
jgi:hypothetical protein